MKIRIVFLLVMIASPEAWGKNSESPIANFRQVTESIYAGGNPTMVDGDVGGVNYLARMGIETVVSLQGADVDGSTCGHISRLIHHGEREFYINLERALVQGMHMEFVNLPVRSRRPWSQVDHQSVDQALAYLVRATPKKPVYIHCQRGIDRTGLIIALYRIQENDWSAEQAYAEWNGLGRSWIARKVTAALDDFYCERNFLSRKALP